MYWAAFYTALHTSCIHIYILYIYGTQCIEILEYSWHCIPLIGITINEYHIIYRNEIYLLEFIFMLFLWNGAHMMYIYSRLGFTNDSHFLLFLMTMKSNIAIKLFILYLLPSIISHNAKVHFWYRGFAKKLSHGRSSRLLMVLSQIDICVNTLFNTGANSLQITDWSLTEILKTGCSLLCHLDFFVWSVGRKTCLQSWIAYISLKTCFTKSKLISMLMNLLYWSN